MDLSFPIEFVVEGTPVSLQASTRSRNQWKTRVRSAARAALPDQFFSSYDRMAVQMFYFPDSRSQADIDNIVKGTIDALRGLIFQDDSQVDRIVIHRFWDSAHYPGVASATLEAALSMKGPVLYVRVSDDPFEDFGHEH